MPEQPTPIAVAVVLHAGRVLVGRRPEGAPLAGLWEFPGGKVRRSESARQAAVRECREETGLEVRPLRLLAETQHDYEHGRVRIDFYLCEPVDPHTPPERPFGWTAVADLAGMDFPAANREVIARLVAEPGGPRGR